MTWGRREGWRAILVTVIDNLKRCDWLNHVTSRLLLYFNDKMPMEFATYIVQLNDAILLENGPNLAYLLRPTSPHGKDLVKEFRNPTVRGNILAFMRDYNTAVISVLRWVDMKGVWKVHGTTFRFSMCWYARMLRKSVMWRLLKRNHNLFRQSF